MRKGNDSVLQRRWELALLLALLGIVWQSPLRGQDEPQAEEEELVIDAGFEIAASNFDQWVFGVQHAEQGRQRIGSLLTLRVEAVDRVCGLTEEQIAKLKLAGLGDVKRFYDDVDVVRAKFMKVRRNRNAFNNIWQDIQPLQARVNAGLFDGGSLFSKVLNRILDVEQVSKFEQAEWERVQFRYHAKLELIVAMMERTMPLRAAQRDRFIQVLKEETQPPRAFGQHDYYVVLYQLDKVPDQKLKPIFDDAQWKVLNQFADQGRAMEAWLKQQKVLP